MAKTIIAMWSGPRSLSTAMMRAFENRGDTEVFDEPFYAHFLEKTGIDHPGRNLVLRSQNTNWNEIVDICIGSIPNGKSIWYQKHMAQHNLSGCDLEWTKKMINCFLIRNPKDVIVSFNKKFELTSSMQLGFTQQLDLFEKLKNE